MRLKLSKKDGKLLHDVLGCISTEELLSKGFNRDDDMRLYKIYGALCKLVESDVKVLLDVETRGR